MDTRGEPHVTHRRLGARSYQYQRGGRRCDVGNTERMQLEVPFILASASCSWDARLDRALSAAEIDRICMPMCGTGGGGIL
eukprot:scaffold264874_cov36-Tisochrysis_lutea.AAC.1